MKHSGKTGSPRIFNLADAVRRIRPAKAKDCKRIDLSKLEAEYRAILFARGEAIAKEHGLKRWQGVAVVLEETILTQLPGMVARINAGKAVAR